MIIHLSAEMLPNGVEVKRSCWLGICTCSEGDLESSDRGTECKSKSSNI